MSVVADCSAFLAWSLADEDEPVAIEAVRRVVSAGGVPPVIWWYELRNALLTNERRGRITAQQVAETLADCAAFGIETDDRHDETLVLALAREHGLSVYAAADCRWPRSTRSCQRQRGSPVCPRLWRINQDDFAT